jgi:hypothetical protein
MASLKIYFNLFLLKTIKILLLFFFLPRSLFYYYIRSDIFV